MQQSPSPVDASHDSFSRVAEVHSFQYDNQSAHVMPFRTVVQDLVDTLSPSSLTIHGESQPRSRRRFHSLPSRPYTTYSPIEYLPGMWYKDSGLHAVYKNQEAMSSVISSSTYYTAFSSFSSFRSRCRSFSDLRRASGSPVMAAKTSSRLRLVQNGAASTVSLAPIVEAVPTARGQPVKCGSNSYDQSGQPILPDLSEGSASIIEVESELERDAPTVETTGRSSTTTTTHVSSSSSTLVEVDHMTPDDMFQHLLEHGCDDLTCSIDPEKYSSCRIDQGGFGDIWHGQFHNGLFVAVKVLRFALVAEGRSKALKRMMREIYAWSKLDHENVHKLLGVTIHQGQLGMVSEWMTNGNLRNYLSRNPSVDRYKLARVCIQIAKAVKYIHDRDMIHGDIKAANVLVSSDSVVKLTDFDYSLIPDCSLLFSDTTRIGCGTLRWMAPELVLQTSFQRSKQTDVYALGMTFLEVITGALPYHPQCHLDAQVVAKLVHKSFPERSTAYFACNKRGDETWKLLTQCWNHDPAARPNAKAVLTWVSMCSGL